MKVGFTGARSGTKTSQLHELRSYLISHFECIDEFHHGCCVGADTFAHHEAYNLGIHIVYHPPVDMSQASDLRAFDGTWRKPKQYLIRNHDIVDETDILIAMPNSIAEVQRSGTWATIRYARDLGREVLILKGGLSYGR